MKRTDIEFLRELQHELQTQDHDGQAAPRYWGICQDKILPAPEGCGDPAIFMGDGDTLTCEEFVDFIENEDYESGYEDEWADVDKSDMEELVAFANDTLKWFDVRIVYEQEVRCIINHDSNVFLTKRACKKHIEENHYNYSKPHTYAMTAWRNPEFERVLNLLTTMNIDDIKVEDE